MFDKLIAKAALAVAVPLVASAANAAVSFTGVGWTLTVTFNTILLSAVENPFAAFQDANTARVGFAATAANASAPSPTAVIWNSASNPSTVLSPDPNTIGGTYTLTANTGYVLNNLDLRANGGYLTDTSGRSGSVALDGISSNYVFSTVGPTVLGRSNGLWTANAADIALSGTSHSGSFLFTNNPFSSLSSMSGAVDGGPTFLVSASVSPIPEPGEWAMLLAGLGAVGLMVRRRKAGRLI